MWAKARVQRTQAKYQRAVPLRLLPPSPSYSALLAPTTVTAYTKALSQAIREATTQSVPHAVAKRAPFWTPELSQLDKEIENCRSDREYERLVWHRRNILKDIATQRWRQHCSKLNPGQAVSWNLISAVYAPRPLSSPVMVRADRPLTSHEHATLLVKMYAKKSTCNQLAPSPRLIPRPKRPPPPISMRELNTTLEEIHLGSAPGPDHIHCESLVHLPPLVKRKVLRLFNRSLISGHVPAQWKEGKIIPLLKPGKPADDPVSYRPVSLTSNLCKLMERIFAKRVRDTVEWQICPSQARFRPQHSTVDPLVDVISTITTAGANEKIGAVFIDYARAFDSVDHGCIIAALVEMQVDSHIIAWVHDFLRGRRARVKLHNSYSPYKPFTCGVPRGSVLGPILFIIPMNSLSKALNTVEGVKHTFFADDLNIFVKSRDTAFIENRLQTALNTIASWTRRHFMEWSAPKTFYTLFRSPVQDGLSLNIDGTPPYRRTDTPGCLECASSHSAGSVVMWKGPSKQHATAYCNWQQ